MSSPQSPLNPAGEVTAGDKTAGELTSGDQRGVKDDISDLKQTLTRHFRGVASFLAPPPQSPRPDDDDDVAGVEGVRGDLAEIRGKVRSRFAKIASSFLHMAGPDDENDERERERDFGDVAVVGVTDEVVSFARDVSMHHETWLNFPLPDDDDDDDEFDLSDAQQEHALAVERLAPGLADLRFALCPSYMSESCFWKIYFVLLHPKLDKNDAVVLSTPQILKARAYLTAELRHKPKPKANLDISEKITTVNEISVPSKSPSEPTTVPVTSTVDTDIEIEKHSIQNTQVPIIDKSVVDEGTTNPVKNQNSNPILSSKMLVEKYDDDGDDWLKEDGSELAGAVKSTVHIEDDEDVSFSDLEED